MSNFTFAEFEVLKQELILKNGLALNSMGHSMHPIIVSGDKIFVSPIEDFSTLKRFDLIVYWDHNVLMCHYLWNQNKVFVSQQGQGLLQLRPINPLKNIDQPIPQNQILGRLSSGRIPLFYRMKILIHALWQS